MTASQWARLREEQETAVQQTNAKIQQLEVFRQDYVVLEERLSTLPHKLHYDVMVPFGKKAFMPGQLIHTNELLVLLGDNWFVERSAKQASEIIHRRIEGLDRQIRELQQQRDLLSPRLDFTSQIQQLSEDKDVFEIQEEFDEEKEKIWREEHRKKVRKFHQEKHRERENMEKTKKVEETKTEEEIWSRLEELHRQEREGREIHRMGENTTESSKHVRWGDEATGGGGESDDEDGQSEEEEEEEEGARSSVITFTHTPCPATQKTNSSSDCSQFIQSPADVVKLLSASSPRSILKPSEPTPHDTTCSATVTHKQEALSGRVVESGEKCSHQQTTDKPPARVSRFKAQRLGQK